MSVAYNYLRVSHPNSAASGLSHDAQQAECRRYFAYRLEPLGVEFGPFFYDAAQSGYKIPFLLRGEGWKLYQCLKPGDHVIVAFHDRFTRDLLDFEFMHRQLEKRNIGLHFANFMGGVDLSTPEGLMVARIMFSVAQQFSAAHGRRVKAAMQAKIARTGYTASESKTGYIKVGTRKAAWLEPWPEERELLRLMLALHNRAWCWQDIANKVEEWIAELRVTRPECICYRPGIWTRYKGGRCRRAVRQYKQLIEREGGSDCTEGVNVRGPLYVFQDGGQPERYRLIERRTTEYTRLRRHGKITARDDLARMQERAVSIDREASCDGQAGDV
jgi:DNA invertase Pin-like site-specific DNA recombinase